MDYLDQKDYAKTINAAKNKPVPQLKWYTENELKNDLLDIQEKGINLPTRFPTTFM
jgi:phospholipase C